MGVPSFYRWLSEKYPQCVYFADTGETSADAQEKYPSKREPERIDNLYLDGNGLIHPCCHPESGPQPSDEDEMIRNIFVYIDKIMGILRPQRLLYLAIDGVAPRAKMNQQRARRFRAAQEVEEKALVEESIRERFAREGRAVPPPKPKPWDHNAITPGTEFMYNLSNALQFYVNERITSDPLWKGLVVIFSDASVPGEGEHKIMSYIRLQRSQLGYPPNMTHVLYGMDADLIMLGLATHEVNFFIFRETILFGKEQICKRCGGKGHNMAFCKGTAIPIEDIEEQNQVPPFQMINIATLREYLTVELYVDTKSFRWLPERAIDDFVFLCFFVGNDFLPHLPSLDIREGALEDLITIYKESLASLGGFITDQGHVDLLKANVILQKVGELEPVVFRNRKKQQDQNDERNKSAATPQKEIHADTLKQAVSKKRKLEETAEPTSKRLKDEPVNFHELLKEEIKKSQTHQVQDDIRFGQDEGWKLRYYTQKFKFTETDVKQRTQTFQNVAHEYIKGLCWVMLYYYEGCVSWNWYFPYHYAPLASDLFQIDRFNISFELSKPLTPLQQLMSVLPEASGHCLPKPFRNLMKSNDSPILDFYPTDFKLDLNGKRFSWQAVVLLPFIDEERLKNALSAVYPGISSKSKKRDKTRSNLIFVRTTHTIGVTIRSMYLRLEMNGSDKTETKEMRSLGFFGTLETYKGAPVPGESIQCCISDVPVLQATQAVAAKHNDPQFRKHVCALLPGAERPRDRLTQTDITQMYNKRRFGGRSILGGNSHAQRSYSSGGNHSTQTQRDRYDPRSMPQSRGYHGGQQQYQSDRRHSFHQHQSHRRFH